MSSLRLLRQKLLAFLLEALPAYTHLIWTRRWVRISQLPEEAKAFGPFSHVSMAINCRAPSLKEDSATFRLYPTDHPEEIPFILIREAEDVIKRHHFPRTTSLIKWDGGSMAIKLG